MLRACSVILGIVFFSLSWFIPASAQYVFKQKNLVDGLSQATITQIVQDEHGFLWFSTQDGLNRFDGYNFVTFRKEQFPILSDNYIVSMDYHIQTHSLWFGTIDGHLYQLNTADGSIKEIQIKNQDFGDGGFYRAIIADNKSLWLLRYNDGLYHYDSVSAEFKKIDVTNTSYMAIGGKLVLDQNKHHLWLATDNGLLCLNTDNKSIIQSYTSEQFSAFKNNTVLTMALDSLNHRIWIGTNSGLFALDTQSNKVIQPFTNNTLSKAKVLSLHIDSKNSLWIGTFNDGLFVSDSTRTSLTQFRHDANKEIGIGSNYINAIFEDKSSLIWLATAGSGLSYADIKEKKMLHFNHDSDNPSSLKHNMVRSFYEDKTGTVWVATGGGGLNMFNPKTLSFSGIPSSKNKPKNDYSFVWDITSNSTQTLFLGTANGVATYNPNTGKYTSYPLIDEPVIIIHTSFINDSLLLAGSLGKGFFILNTKNGESQNYYNPPDNSGKLPNNFIITSAKYSDKTYWIGTFGGGLFLWDTKTDSFTPPTLLFDDFVLSDSKITSLIMDSDSILWVGTSNGLNRVNLSSKTIEIFKEKQGLPNNYIYSIEKDKNGFIWVSTNRGLSRLDVSKIGRDRIVNYSLNDGIQSLEFNTGASLLHSNGDIYFGGTNGFNLIKPSTMVLENANPPLVVSSYSINNENAVYFLNENNTNLTLQPNDHTISFNLANLDFTNSESNQFAYFLDGFNDEWLYTQNRNYIQFTNLNPGDYSLFLKGTNADGIWGQPTKILTIHVIPTIWSTWWFKSLLALGVFAIVLNYFFRIQKRKSFLQTLVNKKTQELSKSEELYRMIAENVADTIMVIRQDLKIEYVSPSISNMLGYIEREFYEAEPFSWVHPDDIQYLYEAATVAFKRDSINTFEFRMIHKNGSIKIISATSKLAEQTDKHGQKLISVLRDITAIRMYEDALIESRQEAIEANKAKSMFLAGMSHELRTPLNAILGFAQILQNDDEIPRRKRDFIQTMYKSGNHLLRMINDVLDFSKIEAGKQQVKLSVFDLMSMTYELESMFSLQSQNKKLNFEFEFESSTPRYIKSDPSKLQQILINLIGNAVKFTNIGSVIFTVKATDFAENKTCIVQFIIEDTGVGINENHLKTIFDPFQQVEQIGREGTGLGLSISKKLVDLLDGEISVESQTGKGSKFTIQIPVEYELVMDLDQHDDFEKWHYEGLKVLVVDDIQNNRDMAFEMLRQYNMAVHVAESGMECLKLLHKHEYDIILMDFLMPEMSGKETLDEIRKEEKWSDIPVIALTAFGLNKSGEDFLEMGFNGYLSKPLSKKELLQQIAKSASLTSEGESHAEETLEELDIQLVAAAILSLEDSEKNSWSDALEILDLDLVMNILSKSNLNEDVITHIRKEIESTNYRFFISLSELVI
ncbi:response regulator [bacterium]|nr:MAG: response regulator [bacterium]